MIVIDGSYGEGGGQILRTAVSLSAVIKEEVTIRNIRKSRPQPGLKTQHLTSIKTAALMCDAQVEGLFPGSTEIRFSPVEIKGLNTEIDIGTAGSIPLLIQCIMPAAAHASGNVSLRIKGGTDVIWSPSTDYLENVTFKALSRMGYRAHLKTVFRGYYPRGGGLIELSIEPSRLTAYDYTREDRIVSGISHSSRLPEHVAQRQASSAQDILETEGYECKIGTEITQNVSTGSGINLCSGFKGAVSIGKKGLPAEKVGAMAAGEMLQDLRSDAAVDRHLADQLIPFMGLAGSGSLTTVGLTEHTSTNIWVTEQFLDVKFGMEKRNGSVEIHVL
ncbi:MAG: 3-terminal phosphate cyclase [Methanolobus sp.]|nr:3-terminal phosphate cyclase [Methanolobus sp.]